VRVGLVGVGIRRAPHQARETELEHHVEDAVEEDERAHEVDLAQRLVHRAPEHLREPVIEGREDRHHRAGEDHVVEVRDDDVGVVDEMSTGVEAIQMPDSPR
jgi:hypothetical protein